MNEKERLKLWIREILTTREVANEKLFSLFNVKSHLEKLIRHPSCPFFGLRIEVKQHHVVFDSGIIGTSGDVKKSIVDEPLSGEQTHQAVISIDVWIKVSSLSTTEIFEALRSLVSELWMPDARQTKFGSLDYQQNSVKNRLAVSLESSQEDEFYVVFYDLDGFKAVNDTVGYTVGDNVLRDVSATVENLAHENDIIGVCKGGDEFGLIVKGNILRIFEIVMKLRDEVFSRNYGEQNLKVGFTSGIVRLPPAANYQQIDEAFTEASKCMTVKVKQGKGEKKKGTVSFASSHAAGKVTKLTIDEFIKLGLAISWIKQGVSAPFSNIFLNIISSRVASIFTFDNANFSSEIANFVAWLDIKERPQNSTFDLVGPQIESATLSKYAICIAIVHGILCSDWFKINNTEELALEFSQSHCSIVWKGNVIAGISIPGAQKINIAQTLLNRGNETKFSPALAIKIGFSSIISDINISSLIGNFFSDVVVVDDRPKTGGGLPDFWQAAVAHVFSILAENPSIKSVFVFGDPSNAPETLKRLTSNSDINVDEIAAVTMLPQATIQECRERLTKPGAIKNITSDKELIEMLYNDTFGYEAWLPAILAAKTNLPSRMKRRLDTSDLVLRQTDGLRCTTAAQAYPLIVEILRTSDSVSGTFDDASQSLNEVIGFKLALEQPLLEPIPEYWQNQREAFEEYARDVLINTNSTIGENLYAGGQLDAFISQLHSYCNSESTKKSTRRAILVVPNIVVDTVMKPLGLVSVWATPRFSEQTMTLEFCFVWRTVEALVGLPYSLYGSIALSEYICSEIRKRLSGHENELSLQSGGLTYLALSLHMRVDDFHKRIAKRIVDAASI